MNDVSGKVAVVTGGGFGIGKAVGVVTDVSNFDQMKNLADTAFDTHGKVHIALCNAGVGGGGSFFDENMDGFDVPIGVNIRGTLNGILNFLPRMHAQDEWGFITGTTSGAGANGTMYTGPGYAFTKMAVLSIMESLWGQLKDMDSKIRCGCIFPTLTRSNMGSDFVEDMLQQMGVPAVLAEPEELANVIVEGIENDTFFINPTHEQDEKYFGGRLKPNLDWSDEFTLRKAKAMCERTDPSGYIWGGPGGAQS